MVERRRIVEASAIIRSGRDVQVRMVPMGGKILVPGPDERGGEGLQIGGMGPDRAVVAIIGVGQQREPFGMGFPGKITAVDDDAADGCPMPADKFRCRMYNYRSTVIERSRDERRRRIVDDQWYAQAAPDGRDLGDRKNGQL